MKEKKTDFKKVSIEFDERHLNTLVTALDIYSRLRSGQIATALGNAFVDRDCLTYEDLQVIESIVRTLTFRKDKDNIIKSPNSYYGIGCEELKDGTIAWEIKKAIEQYRHYESNDGYREIMNTGADGAMQYSEVPVPRIIENGGYWKPQKSFIVPQKYQKQIEECIASRQVEGIWAIIDKAFKKIPLPKGKTSRIEKHDGTFYVVVEEPLRDRSS